MKLFKFKTGFKELAQQIVNGPLFYAAFKSSLVGVTLSRCFLIAQVRELCRI